MKQIILSYILLLTCSTFGQSAVKVLLNNTTTPTNANRTVQVDASGNFKVVNTPEYVDSISNIMQTSKLVNDAGFITSSNAPVQSVNGQTGAVNVFDGNYNNLSNKPTLFSGAYNDLTGKPALFSGSYLDLTDKPNIPLQLNAVNGTGINITGTYPNLTFNSTIAQSGQVYSKTALLGTGITIVDTFSISSATPTISFAAILSTVGKSNFKITSCTGYRASASATNSPNVAITALTSNSATFILTQQNASTITILGINVLSGLPMVVVPDPANVKLVLSLIAY